MKTRLLLLALLLAGGSHLFAEEINVDPSNYESVYNNANDNDVLLLADGEYTNRLYFPSQKTITLKAAPGANPVIKFDIYSTTDCTDGGLIIDGVYIDRRNSATANFIDVTLRDIKLISFRNLTVEGVYRCTVLAKKVEAANTIQKIEFDNCIIKDCDRGGWNFIYTQHGVQEITVTNSTLYNYSGGESFFCVYAANTNNVLNFTFENNTVYKWGKDGTRALAKIESNYSTESTYTFRNNIITEPGGSQLPMIADISGGTLTAENNLVVNYGGYKGGTQTISDLTLESLGMAEIGFIDPANGNFSIVADSPIATAGTDGGPIGDPRWMMNITTPVTLTTGNANTNEGTTSPATITVQEGIAVTATATANFGYRFTEWQDAEGNTLSTENPYTFDLIEDTDLIAIFVPATSFITSWNFVTSEAQPTIIPGYAYSNEENKGTISMYSHNGNLEWMDIRDKTFGGITHKAPRRWTPIVDLNAHQSRYFEAIVDTDGYENIKITSLVAADNDNVFKTQYMEYSTDEQVFTTAASIDIVERNKWYELNAVLPKVAGTLYVRWNSTGDFLDGRAEADNTEGLFLANVCVFGDKVSETSYTRDFYVDGAYETLCLPFDVTAVTDGSGNAVTPVFYEYKANASGSDQVTFVKAESIQAHTPYLISFPADNSIEKLPFTFTGTTAAAKEPISQAGSYAFTGTYDKFNSNATYYVLNNTGDGFVKAVATTFVGAYRAYLALAGGGGNQGVKQLTIAFDDDGGATGIEEPASAPVGLTIEPASGGIKITATDVQIVNIHAVDGRLLNQSQLNARESAVYNLAKGIYIVNNQKVIVK